MFIMISGLSCLNLDHGLICLFRGSICKKIEVLIDEDGFETHYQENICGIANQYFHELFTASVGVYDPVIRNIQGVVTTEDNR